MKNENQNDEISNLKRTRFHKHAFPKQFYKFLIILFVILTSIGYSAMNTSLSISGEVLFIPIASEVCDNNLMNCILAKEGGSSAILLKAEPNLATMATTDEGMYATKDESGMSYYFRGAVQNNFLIFANLQWRIIRINGNGTIKLLYNGVCPDNDCEMNTTGPNTQIGTSPFNSTSNSNGFVGYMYGSPNSNNYKEEHDNINDSTIKNVIDTWYANNILTQGDNITSKINDSVYCADRSINFEGNWESGIVTNFGYGTHDVFYAANVRLYMYSSKEPTLLCSSIDDALTVNNTGKGNGKLTYPVGLITADEVSLAGTIWGNYTSNINNDSFYLYTGESYWTITPSAFWGMAAYVWHVNTIGTFDGLPVQNSHGVRPVITLKSSTEIISGNGSRTNPYKVKENDLPIIEEPIEEEPIKLYDNILLVEGGTDAIINKGTPNFSATATNNQGMYAGQDNYGTSYFYRGAVTNNNVMFAGFAWKIIRINGDNSIRLIYNGTSPESTGTATQINNTTYQYNTASANNAYLGYMYGVANSGNYANEHNNINNSNVKTQLDNWYNANILSKGTSITSKIVNNIFCNDRTTHSGSTWGNNNTAQYKGYNRLVSTKNPDLNCIQESDQFTLTTSPIGNKKLSNPVGLITADEIALAGGVYNINNTSFYLHTGVQYWTMTASNSANKSSYLFITNNSGSLATLIPNTASGIRPVINLSPSVIISDGTGTISNPYIIE